MPTKDFGKFLSQKGLLSCKILILTYEYKQSILSWLIRIYNVLSAFSKRNELCPYSLISNDDRDDFFSTFHHIWLPKTWKIFHFVFKGLSWSFDLVFRQKDWFFERRVILIEKRVAVIFKWSNSHALQFLRPQNKENEDGHQGTQKLIFDPRKRYG